MDAHRTALFRLCPLPQFHCCGATNYTDWETIPLPVKGQVPDSCCVNVTQGCGTKFTEKDIYTKVGRRLRPQEICRTWREGPGVEVERAGALEVGGWGWGGHQGVLGVG